MNAKLLLLILTAIGKLKGNKMLDGYKTYISGGGVILIGVIGLVMGLVGADNQFVMEPTMAINTIFAGLAIIGIGGKLDKARADKTPE